VSAELSRRGFLKIAAVAGGGLSVGFLIDGCAHVSGARKLGGGFYPNAWVRITPDDKITFFCDRAEMGQGIMTSHAQLLAEELEVDVNNVDVEFALADPDKYGFQLTGGSTSTTSQFDVIREAGATARELLKSAAATRWAVPLGEVAANNGVVTHPSGKRATYGELADDAARERVGKPVLKEQAEWKVIGKSITRVDAAAKVDGSAVFGLDVRVPGMLYAVVIRSPVPTGRVRRFHGLKAEASAGVKSVREIPQGIAVVASTSWQARQGAKLVEVEWDDGAMGSFSSTAQRDASAVRLEGRNKEVHSFGDVDAALASAVRRIKVSYEVPFLAHATMEPQNCTASVRPSMVEVWAPTQAATIAQEVASKITGRPYEEVVIRSTFMGGGFGRRAMSDFVAEAVELSMRMRAPVQVVWSREDDIRHGQYRPASVAVMEGAVDESGLPVAWSHRMSGQTLMAAFASMMGALDPEQVPRPIGEYLGSGFGDMFKKGMLTDPTAIEGAADQPYDVPHRRVEFAQVENSVPVFPWRSVGHSIHAFSVESFIDELATLGGKDPFELRRAMLKDDPREKAVLEMLAKTARWGETLPRGRHQGIAQHASFGSVAGHVVELSVEQGRLHIHRVVSCIDCGVAVNPDLVKAQMESSVIYGLSAALKQQIDFERGRVVQSNFHDFPLLRMNESPDVIETVIMPSKERPTGVGELGVPPIAPAFANALFAATGVRFRKLPIEPQLREVLAKRKAVPA
jgi:CO/xanthine dehydrogenase Mo-binding subunit